MTAAPWRVEYVTLSIGDAHAADLTGPDASRLVRVHEIVQPTLVLGSTQRESDVDQCVVEERGVAVVRRRSGGGAVLLAPGDVVWLDVVVPAGDPLWQDDIGVAFEWVGETWARALTARNVRGAVVHRGRLLRSSWSDRVCFAGLGPGEVSIDGQKVVGISQRRTRHAARFQCAALLRWDAAGIAALLGLTDAARALEGVATGVTVPADDLVEAFLANLPA